MSDRHNVDERVTTINRNDNAGSGWSPTPGNYAGMTPLVVNEDSVETLQSNDVDLNGLNKEAKVLAKRTSQNFVELGM